MNSYFFLVCLAHSYYPKQLISICTISKNPLRLRLYFSKPGINSPTQLDVQAYWGDDSFFGKGAPKEPKEWGIVQIDLQFLDAFWLSMECHTETFLQLHTQYIRGTSSKNTCCNIFKHKAHIHYPGFKDKLLISWKCRKSRCSKQITNSKPRAPKSSLIT